jgi:flagellar biosynthesis protein FlhF
MKVRKYYARNMHEGLRQIKQDLGPEAVIIHSCKVRSRGLKGLFEPRRLEITAAVESRNTAKLSSAPPATLDSAGELIKELTELKSAVHKLILLNGDQETAPDNEGLQFWERKLRDHDLHPELVKDIFDNIRLNLQGEVQLTDNVLTMVLHKKIAQRVKAIREDGWRRQVFIGPTGVGKTTTLAKLAARYSMFQQKKVGLITIDHFRIGAVEQLRTYAEILDVPLEVVMSTGELPEALRRLEHCDRILVDTVGRGTGSLMQISEMAAYISQLLPAAVFLTVSATTRHQDIALIAESFKKLQYNYLILTKLDETRSYGAPLNAVHLTGKPLVFITDGQNVPDDLKEATAVDIPGMLIGGGNDG